MLKMWKVGQKRKLRLVLLPKLLWNRSPSPKKLLRILKSQSKNIGRRKKTSTSITLQNPHQKKSGSHHHQESSHRAKRSPSRRTLPRDSWSWNYRLWFWPSHRRLHSSKETKRFSSDHLPLTESQRKISQSCLRVIMQGDREWCRNSYFLDQEESA